MTYHESWIVRIEDAGGWTAPAQTRLQAFKRRLETDFGFRVTLMQRLMPDGTPRKNGGAK